MKRWKVLSFVFLAALLGILSAVAQPAQAQSAVWTAQYYNNPFLADPVALTRQDGAVSFNWGSGSPASGINADNFSVRWGTDVYFNAGTYRFWALADDNIRVTLDFGQVIIDTFASPSVGRTVSADVSLSAGSHHIQVDYREAGGDAYAFVTWANAAGNPSPPNFLGGGGQPGSVAGQWTAQYYNNPFLNGSPAVTVIEPSITKNWGYNAPISGIGVNDFSVRWTSQQALTGGTYRVSVRADDGVRVYVNGSLVINEWHDAINTTYNADVSLPAGTHTFVVEYYEATNLAFIEFTLAAVGNTPPVYVPPQTPINTGGAWLAYYFNNRDLAGSPTAIVSESNPSHNWGTGSPIASIGADNFSARWVSTQNLTAGAYRLTARADDGVRVYVNGALVINEWHGATGQTYTADVNLPAGTHTFTLEYYEAGGAAFVELSLGAAGGGSGNPTNPPANTGATATVTAYRLNVRNTPSISGSTILVKIDQGQTYPIVGRTTDRTWYQISANGVTGWVYARFVNANNASNVPVTSGSTTTPNQGSPTGYTVTPGLGVNVRSGPGLSNPVLGVLRTGQTAQVLGRNTSSTWWYIDYAGLRGWVSAIFAPLSAGSDLSRIPVVN
jgi:uncharacterized protein YraI